MSDKVVVFGGGGFLGSHVADMLSDDGYKVVIFDIVVSKFVRDDQEMITGNILDRDLIKSVIQGAKYVYHFAAIADIKEAQDNPVEAVETNILSTTYILDACREFGVKRFLFGSTIYVYSEHGSFYRSTKQASELIIENYQKIYNLDYTILRYGSLYGPRANHFNFINRVIVQALKNKEIVREGNGEELREYIHIKDAARASTEILVDNFSNANIMITGTKSLKIRDILSMIKEMLNEKIDIKYTNNILESHYNITPYSFKPKVAKKYQLNYYHDLGQGILDQIYFNYEKLLSEGEIKDDNIFTNTK
jgi:UDP-glucose 4-epimerase